MIRLDFPALLAAALLLGLAIRADAQTVRGRVIDDSTAGPVGGVALGLVDEGGREVGRTVRSVDDGSFRVHAPGSGTYRIVARRIGYAPLTTSQLEVGLGEVVTVEVRLSRVAQVIAPVRIVARAHVDLRELMSSDGFDLRRERGIGRFAGTEDLDREIARFGSRTTIGLLAENGFSGMGTAWGSMDQVFRIDHRCTPHVYLDGFRATSGGTDYGDNAFQRVAPIPAAEVYGIEIYRKYEIPPPSVGATYGNEPLMDDKGISRSDTGINGFTMMPNTCGIIAVWTKGGMRSMGAVTGMSEPALRGTVITSVTDAVIAGATVTLHTERGLQIGAPVITDSVGQFAVRIPTRGRYRLRAKHGSHDEVMTPAFAADTGQTIVVELTMAVEGRIRAPLTILQKVRGGLPLAIPASGGGAVPPPMGQLR